jgi:hypothetical protein
MKFSSLPFLKPVLLFQKRGFDTKFYKFKQKQLKAQRNQEDVSFTESLSTLSIYRLGIPSPLRAHVQLGALETNKPIRGEVDFPFPLSQSAKKPIILVFAKVTLLLLLR